MKNIKKFIKKNLSEIFGTAIIAVAFYFCCKNIIIPTIAQYGFKEIIVFYATTAGKVILASLIIFPSFFGIYYLLAKWEASRKCQKNDNTDQTKESNQGKPVK